VLVAACVVRCATTPRALPSCEHALASLPPSLSLFPPLTLHGSTGSCLVLALMCCPRPSLRSLQWGSCERAGRECVGVCALFFLLVLLSHSCVRTET
jgi:hypothetical protein